ncbi:MAG: hypothetical protein WKF30_13410 [Pyrinomonadaceae bacterium]
MKIKFTLSLLLCAALVAQGAAQAAPTSASSERQVRDALERAFAHLRGGEYDALYDALPTTSQRRVSRERFTGALAKTRGMFALDRMDIGRVQVLGDVAAAETTVYGRAERPFPGEGKISVQQFLVRETACGVWPQEIGPRRRLTCQTARVGAPLSAARAALVP